MCKQTQKKLQLGSCRDAIFTRSGLFISSSNDARIGVDKFESCISRGLFFFFDAMCLFEQAMSK